MVVLGKNSEIVPNPLCLGGISKDFSSLNVTGLCGYVYDFSADYRAISNYRIQDIHRYLMKKKQYHINDLVYKKNIGNDIFSIGCEFFKMHFNKKIKSAK